MDILAATALGSGLVQVMTSEPCDQLMTLNASESAPYQVKIQNSSLRVTVTDNSTLNSIDDDISPDVVSTACHRSAGMTLQKQRTSSLCGRWMAGSALSRTAASRLATTVAIGSGAEAAPLLILRRPWGSC